MGRFDEMRRFFNGVPSLLNFSKASGPDIIYFGESQYAFTGEFYFEIEGEYSVLDSTYACFAGALGSENQVFRLLVGATTTIVNIAASSPNLSLAKTTTTNTRYTIKVRRNASNQVYVSYNGGAETNIGTKTGIALIRYIASETVDTSGRKLTGKIYRFDINGDEYLLTEGSGNKVYGSLGGEGTIGTFNAGGLTYINSTMWEAL